MAKYFGLQKGDSIVEISPQGEAMMPVKEMESAGAAKDELLSAYERSQHIMVKRGGQTLTLPQAPQAKPTAAAAPSPPAASPQQQLENAVKNIPTH
jgi:hypothetical protein